MPRRQRKIPREPDVRAIRVELHAAAARRRQDAAPVRIGAGKHRFHQRRCAMVRATLPGGRSLGAPRTSISITRLRPRRRHDLQRQGMAHLFERLQEAP